MSLKMLIVRFQSAFMDCVFENLTSENALKVQNWILILEAKQAKKYSNVFQKRIVKSHV